MAPSPPSSEPARWYMRMVINYGILRSDACYVHTAYPHEGGQISMILCRSCGSTFTGNFCTNCGSPAQALCCPRCNAQVAPNTAFCAYCGTALAASQFNGQVPQPPNPPQQQNNMGKYLMGALGGAAAVIGGEILLHDVEKGIERHTERDVERREWRGEFAPHHHHHHRHHRRCACGHEYGMEIEICPRCRRRWGSW